MLYFIRHGETAKNKQLLLQGRSDTPLNEAGIRQSRDAGIYFADHHIRFDLVWSSPLTRAVETARLAAGGDVPILTDDRLLEMDYGPYEGSSLLDPAPEVIHFFKDFVHNPAPEGMESLPSVVQRLGRFLEDIRDSLPENGNVLISTHAIALKGALEYLTPDAGGYYWSKNIANCAIYRSALVDGGFLVPEELRNGN